MFRCLFLVNICEHLKGLLCHSNAGPSGVRARLIKTDIFVAVSHNKLY